MIEYREDKEFEEAQLECLFLSVQRESGRFAKKAGADVYKRQGYKSRIYAAGL